TATRGAAQRAAAEVDVVQQNLIVAGVDERAGEGPELEVSAGHVERADAPSAHKSVVAQVDVAGGEIDRSVGGDTDEGLLGVLGVERSAGDVERPGGAVADDMILVGVDGAGGHGQRAGAGEIATCAV